MSKRRRVMEGGMRERGSGENVDASKGRSLALSPNTIKQVTYRSRTPVDPAQKHLEEFSNTAVPGGNEEATGEPRNVGEH
jgi:hypothetical protein